MAKVVHLDVGNGKKPFPFEARCGARGGTVSRTREDVTCRRCLVLMGTDARPVERKADEGEFPTEEWLVQWLDARFGHRSFLMLNKKWKRTRFASVAREILEIITIREAGRAKRKLESSSAAAGGVGEGDQHVTMAGKQGDAEARPLLTCPDPREGCDG